MDLCNFTFYHLYFLFMELAIAKNTYYCHSNTGKIANKFCYCLTTLKDLPFFMVNQNLSTFIVWNLRCRRSQYFEIPFTSIILFFIYNPKNQWSHLFIVRHFSKNEEVIKQEAHCWPVGLTLPWKRQEGGKRLIRKRWLSFV